MRRQRGELHSWPPPLDANGYVNEDQRAARDDARITHAIETADWLDNLTAHLERLATEPPRSVCTLMFGALGDPPDSFTLYGTDVDDALRTLRALPTFLHRSTSRTPADASGTSTVLEFHGEWTHPHLSAPGHRYDLRAEQTAASARPAALHPLAPTSERPAVPPAAGAPPHRR